MKKTFLLTAILLLSIGAAFAGNGNKVQALISKTISVPPSLKNHKLNEKVNVQFSVSGNGQVTFVDVSTDHPELRKYVKEQISGMDFGPADENKETTYFININFKVL